MPSLGNIIQALNAVGSAMLVFSLLVITPTPSSLSNSTLPSASSFVPPANDRVASCDEANYPTPTPPPNAEIGQRSPYGAERDRFAVAEALQMPTGPSAFDANGNLLPNATAPVLPPAPVRQFALVSTPTPDANGNVAPFATPTIVATPTPATPKRVVIQAGHWQNSDLPYQLAQFAGDGGYANGIAEWKLNLHVATIAANLLRARGYDVRIVPATIPIGCAADAFIALHADSDTDPYANGYKAAYPRDINNPANRNFLADVYIEYGAATGLDRSSAITLNMSGYYAFDNQKQPYAVTPSTPMLVLEMGYISNYSESEFLSTHQDIAALGVANGVDRFLHGKLVLNYLSPQLNPLFTHFSYAVHLYLICTCYNLVIKSQLYTQRTLRFKEQIMKNISQKRTTQSIPPARMASIAQGRVAASPPLAVESNLQHHWESLPLRLFLGIIFFFAGLDKVTDPTFFDPSNGNYIGNQLQGYVTYNHSPLSFLLTGVAIPHAQLFGWMFALGELAAGLFALLGLYTRAAAALGLLLSTTLWLTASWGQQPFYTSWDLPYMFGWLTLLLLGAGTFSLDEWRARQHSATAATAPLDHERRHFLVRAGATIGAVAALLIAGGEVFSGFATRNQPAGNAGTIKTTGTKGPSTSGSTGSATSPTSIPPTTASNIPTVQPTDTPAQQNTGNAVGSASPQPTDTLSPVAPTDTPAPPAGPINPPTPTTAAPAGTLIAHTSDVPVGGGLLFTAPDTGDDAYIVHLGDGRYVAFDAICTHQGCTVNYDSQNTIFFCPCHGAEFDPTNDGAVIRRPARSPLAKLNISVDQNSGSIYFISS